MEIIKEDRTLTLSYTPKGDTINIKGVLYTPVKQGSNTVRELTFSELNEWLKESRK